MKIWNSNPEYVKDGIYESEAEKMLRVKRCPDCGQPLKKRRLYGEWWLVHTRYTDTQFEEFTNCPLHDS